MTPFFKSMLLAIMGLTFNFATTMPAQAKDTAKTPSIETIMSGNCLKKYHDTYASTKSHKAFAYLRNAQGKQACGWSYGYQDIASAQKSALQGCKKRGYQGDCVIVDIDGEVVVKAGVFAPIIKPSGPALTPELRQQLNDSAADILKGNCRKSFDKYLSIKGHKAFAYTVGTRGLYYHCNWFSRTVPDTAEKLALDKCNKNRQKSRYLKKFTPTCKTFAKNNQLLLSAKDFQLEIENNLITAAQTKSLTVLKSMLTNDADINQTNKSGTTPLIAATRGEKYDNVAYLLEQKADINHQAVGGFDALNAAAMRGYTPIAKLLLEHGANVNTRTSRGYTPLHHAAKIANIDLMQLLLSQNIDINTANDFGDTALHIAADSGRANAVKWLIKQGASINLKNKHGMTALDIAIKRKRHNVISYLEQKGAKAEKH